jgi:hypothetical protein
VQEKLKSIGLLNSALIGRVQWLTELRTVLIHGVVCYHLSHTVNYKTLRLAVYPASFLLLVPVYTRIMADSIWITE